MVSYSQCYSNASTSLLIVILRCSQSLSAVVNHAITLMHADLCLQGELLSALCGQPVFCCCVFDAMRRQYSVLLLAERDCAGQIHQLQI